MVSEQEQQINNSLEELEQLKKQAEAAQKEELPVRRFRAGVDVRQQQQDVLSRRKQAQESLQLISTEKERLLNLREELRKQEEAQRAIDEENQAREQARKILERGGPALENELRSGGGRVGELLRRAVGGKTIPQAEPKEMITITPLPQDILGGEKTTITPLPQNVLEAFPQQREIIFRLPQKIIGGDQTIPPPQITIRDESQPNRIVVVNPRIVETEIKVVEQKKTFFDRLGEIELKSDIFIKKTSLRAATFGFERAGVPREVAEFAILRTKDQSLNQLEKIIFNSPPLTFGAGGREVREFQVGLFVGPLRDIEEKPTRQIVLLGLGGVFGRISTAASSSKVAIKAVQAGGIALSTAFGVEVTRELITAESTRQRGAIIGTAAKDVAIVGTGFRIGSRLKSPAEFEVFRRVAARADELRIRVNPITEQEILNPRRPTQRVTDFVESTQVSRGIVRNIPRPIEINPNDLLIAERLRNRATGITNRIPTLTRPSAKVVGRIRDLTRIATGGINEPLASRLRPLSNLPEEFTPEGRAFIFRRGRSGRLGTELDIRTTDIQKLSLQRLAENSDVSRLRDLSLRRLGQAEFAGQNLRRAGGFEPIELRPLQSRPTEIQELSLRRLEEAKLRDLSIKQLDKKTDIKIEPDFRIRNQINRFRSGADIALFKEGRFDKIVESNPRFRQQRPLRTPEQEGLRQLSLKRLQSREIKPVEFKITDEVSFRQSIRRAGGKDPVLNAIKTSGILKPFEQSAKGFKETSRIKIFKPKEPEIPKDAQVIKSGNQLLVLERPKEIQATRQKQKTSQSLIPQGRFENLNVGESKFNKQISKSRFKSLGILEGRFGLAFASATSVKSSDAQLSKEAQLSIFSFRSGQSTRQAQRQSQRFRDQELVKEAQALNQGQKLSEALKVDQLLKQKLVTETILKQKTRPKEKVLEFDLPFLLKERNLVKSSKKSLSDRDLVIVADLTGSTLNIERRIKEKDLLKEATRDIPVGIRGIPKII